MAHKKIKLIKAKDKSFGIKTTELIHKKIKIIHSKNTNALIGAKFTKNPPKILYL